MDTFKDKREILDEPGASGSSLEYEIPKYDGDLGRPNVLWG
jgi:hypothetical protein